jgi:hypothetical protein
VALGSIDTIARQATGPATAPTIPVPYGQGRGVLTNQGAWDQAANASRDRFYERAPAIDRTLGVYASQYAPDMAHLDFQAQLARNQIGMVRGQGRLGAQDLRSQFGLDMQGVGLDRQGIGIGRDAANRRIRNTQLQANSDAGQEVRGARSESTASGAMSAPGIRNDMANIYGNLVFQRERNQLGFQRDLLGIREERNTQRDTLRNLDLEAQRLGLRSDELRMGLRTGLRNLRLDTTMSVSDLLGSLSSNNQQRAALARQILDQALAAARGQ